MDKREVGDERTAVWSSSMDAPEALRAINDFSKAIIKDIIHDGWCRKAERGTHAVEDRYDWVYHVHLTRTYRRKQAFPSLVLDTEQPDGRGDSQDPFPPTQPTDTVSDLWGGGGGGAEHSSPAGLLGAYDDPVVVSSNDNSRAPDVCSTEACEVHSPSMHHVLPQGRSSVGDWPPG